MKARRSLRSLSVAGLVIAMAGFILGPATPAAAAVPNPNVGDSDLTVARTGSGSGTVTSSPAGINCGGDCHQAYALVFPFIDGGISGLTLTATPSPDSVFSGWEIEPGSGATNLVFNGHQLTLDIPEYDILDLLALYDPDLGDTLIRARFTQVAGPGTLSVAKAGTGTGTVTSTDGLINCGADCGQTYGHLTQVTLVATPGASSSFAGWSVAGHATNLIGCGGTGSCTLLLNWNNFPFNWHTLVTATFNQVATVAPAAAETFIHTHQHGGFATKFHHGVRHLKKHTHTHAHLL